MFFRPIKMKDDMSNIRKAIDNLDDIKLLVDTFYAEVRKDTLIGGIFNGVIQERWPEHLAKMYRFWQTILLDEYTYEGSPFPPHAQLPLEQHHFERWLALFTQTVDQHFYGAGAERAKWQAARMAQVFLAKIQYLRNQSAT